MTTNALKSASGNTTKALALARIRLDGGTQSRAALDEDVISDYVEHLDELPAPVVFHDGADYWLADGFHRVRAHERAGKTRITVEVRQGSSRDAILYSVGANVSHGLRRTNADKRRAVEMLLRDEEWGGKTNRWIAKACGVSHRFASLLRDQLATVATCAPNDTPGQPRLGQDGKLYVVKRKPAPEPTRERGLPPRTDDEQPQSDVPPMIGGRPRIQFDDAKMKSELERMSALSSLNTEIGERMRAWRWAPSVFIGALLGMVDVSKTYFANKAEEESNV